MTFGEYRLQLIQMSPIKKYDQVEKRSCGETYWELEETHGGDWIRSEDLKPILERVLDAIGCGCGGDPGLCGDCSTLWAEIDELKNN